MAKIKQDVPPFVLIDGSTAAEVVGLNKVGLRRNGYTAEDLLGVEVRGLAGKTIGEIEDLVIGDRPLKEWLEEFHAKAGEAKP